MHDQQAVNGSSILIKAAASAPPVTAGTAMLAGFGLPYVVQILTAVWFAVLIAHKVWKWRIEIRHYENGGTPDKFPEDK